MAADPDATTKTVEQYDSSVREMSKTKFESMKNSEGKIPDLANQIVMIKSEESEVTQGTPIYADGVLQTSTNLVQTTGTDSLALMSQKAITDAISKIKVSFSRYMRWETTTSTAQEGWQYCSFTSVSDGTSGNLADNEFITSVDLTSAGAGQYDNRCIPFNCGFTFTNSGLTAHWWRELNDGNNYLRIIAIVCKFETS